MPVYDYRCEKCGKEFSVTMSIAEHDTAKVQCRHCKSKRVVQIITAVSTKTSMKS